MSEEKQFTLSEVEALVKDAYEHAYYEGAGDDAWYADHTGENSSLNKNAAVHRSMKEYLDESDVIGKDDEYLWNRLWNKAYELNRSK